MFSKTRRPRAASVLLVAAVLAACNSPADSGDQHIVPVGLVILQNGTEIVAATSASVTGAIIATGLQSEQLTVRYMGINGEAIDPGVEYHLVVETNNANVAVWEPTQAGAFVGRVAIRSTGTTNMRFRWMHGPIGGGHSDLDINVPVSVTLSQQPEVRLPAHTDQGNNR
jgi:hypothetical protein